MTNPEDVELASEAFDEMTQSRHSQGQKKYGEVRFLQVDTIEMALEELADLSNYARYTFIQLWLLRQRMSNGLRGSGPGGISNPHAREQL